MDRGAINFVRCLKCRKILECSRYDTSALLQHIRTDHPEVEIVDRDTKGKVHNNRTKDQRTESNSTEKVQHKAKKHTESVKDPATDNNSELECQRAEVNDAEGFVINPKSKTTTRRDFGRGTEMAHQKYPDEEGNKGKSVDRRESKLPYYVPEADMTHISIKSELLEKYPEIKDCEFCPRDPNAKMVYTRRYKIRTPSTTSAISAPRTPRKRHLYRTSIERWRPANGTIYCPKCGCNHRPLIETRTERSTQNRCCASCLLSCWPLCFMPCLWSGNDVEHLHCANCKAFLGFYNRTANCIKPNREFVCVGSQMDVKLKDFPRRAPESGETLPSSITSANDSQKSNSNPNRLPSIVIDGKELHPDMVARLQKFKIYGPLAGIDLEAVTDNNSHSRNTGDYVDSFRDGVPEKRQPSVGNKTNSKTF